MQLNKVIPLCEFDPRGIQTGIVMEVSVDYVLSENDARHTGENALLYLLQYCLENPEYRPPHIYIHSAHYGGSKKLQAVRGKIEALPRLDT